MHPPLNRCPGALRTAGSSRVALQHPSDSFYGCYLPVLTGFKRLTSYKTRPSTPLIRRQTRPAKPAGGNSTPVKRIPGYRAPLAPRLARFGAAPLILSGTASYSKWSQPGSNRQPSHCERDALPVELWPQTQRQLRARRIISGGLPAKWFLSGAYSMPIDRLGARRTTITSTARFVPQSLGRP